jgi:hypothetical protein
VQLILLLKEDGKGMWDRDGVFVEVGINDRIEVS